MRRDGFPTSRRIGRWLIKIAKIPAVQQTCFAVGSGACRRILAGGVLQVAA